MRDIKFRVWHHKDGYMIESAASVATIIQKYLKGWGLGMQNGNYELDGTEYSIMQYTGQNDKKRTKEYPNGQPIFEGDIIPISFKANEYGGIRYGSDFTLNGLVEFNKHQSGFEIIYKENEHNIISSEFGWVDMGDMGDIEVIGNIHQNPELL